MVDDPLLARMNAALRQAQDLRAEALRVQWESASRVAAMQRSSTDLREAMDRSLALRLCQCRARPCGRIDPACRSAGCGPTHG